MKTKLTQGLEQDQKAEFKSEFKSSYRFRERLNQILEDESKTNVLYGTARTKFSDPNWAQEQAFRCGYEAGLRFVKELLSDKDETQFTVL